MADCGAETETPSTQYRSISPRSHGKAPWPLSAFFSSAPTHCFFSCVVVAGLRRHRTTAATARRGHGRPQGKAAGPGRFVVVLSAPNARAHHEVEGARRRVAGCQPRPGDVGAGAGHSAGSDPQRSTRSSSQLQGGVVVAGGRRRRRRRRRCRRPGLPRPLAPKGELSSIFCSSAHPTNFQTESGCFTVFLRGCSRF